MSKPPEDWVQDLGDKAQETWDFALKTCEANAERKRQQAEPRRCTDCDSTRVCEQCYRTRTDRLFHGWKEKVQP